MHSFAVSLGMKALIELHFQHEALPCFIENVLRSMLSYRNETSKECIQFLNMITKTTALCDSDNGYIKSVQIQSIVPLCIDTQLT